MTHYSSLITDVSLLITHHSSQMTYFRWLITRYSYTNTTTSLSPPLPASLLPLLLPLLLNLPTLITATSTSTTTHNYYSSRHDGGLYILCNRPDVRTTNNQPTTSTTTRINWRIRQISFFLNESYRTESHKKLSTTNVKLEI